MSVALRQGESVSLTTGQVESAPRPEAHAWDTLRFKIIREGMAKNDLRALASEFANDYVSRTTPGDRWFR